MAISSFKTAKKLCSLSNWNISNLQLQKLMYLSHLFYLGKKGKPLISRPFEAWKLGPVSPDVYERVKIFKNRPVLNVFYGIKTIEEDNSLYKEEALFLTDIYQKLAQKTASELVDMTHIKDGAWDKARKNQLYSVIKESDILEEYNKFYKKYD